VHKNKEDGLILKLDSENAYDKVSIEFLEEMLKQRGLSQKWLDTIHYLLHKGSVRIRINVQNSNFVETGKGLRQGYPFAPIIFNMIADVFSKMLIKSSNGGLISGLLTRFRAGGIISLQYADHTLLFLKNDLEKALNLKLVFVDF
jgi:hypothetical protein